METKSQAKIISYNINNIDICASAARISTTKGNANEIFEKAKNHPNNQDLIDRVLQSGHKSLIEHSVFTIAFWNVSAFVEQFFIECRLASFTVKSRRYVDFSKLGYYTPSDLDTESLSQYRRYMDMLYGAYQEMLEQGIPKEDARFLLPYSFNSNFYCTLNARELNHIICTIKFGRGRYIPELQDIARQLTDQIESLFPVLLSEIAYAEKQYNTDVSDTNFSNVQDDLVFIERRKIGIPELISSPQNPREILENAYQISHSLPLDIGLLLKSERPRELEQLAYSFLISNITLSGITHIVRHRMQSIIIPSIQSIDHNKYIIPETISNNPALLKRYKYILETTNGMLKQLNCSKLLNKYGYYFALSGNVMDIMTTMNSRELMHFIRLRICNRAQWEIRDISVEMLRQLQEHFPELFNKFGSSCYINGYCPEGRMTCGKYDEVIKKFGQSLRGGYEK